MLVNVEIVVGFEVHDGRIAVLTPAELLIVQINVRNCLESVAQIDGEMVG